jgi:hypothetical protein
LYRSSYSALLATNAAGNATIVAKSHRQVAFFVAKKSIILMMT